MTAKELFDLAFYRINYACTEKNFTLIHLEELGFEKRNLKANDDDHCNLFNRLYSIKGDEGNKVEVVFCCYDPPVESNNLQPDVNKFEIKLLDKNNNLIQYHTNSYED